MIQDNHLFNFRFARNDNADIELRLSVSGAGFERVLVTFGPQNFVRMCAALRAFMEREAAVNDRGDRRLPAPFETVVSEIFERKGPSRW